MRCQSAECEGNAASDATRLCQQCYDKCFARIVKEGWVELEATEVASAGDEVAKLEKRWLVLERSGIWAFSGQQA